MLHYLDDLDSKMESMRAHFQREPDADWTTYNSSLARPLLNSKRFMEKIKSSADGGASSEPDAIPQPSSQAATNSEK
jgi:hypothetical protein